MLKEESIWIKEVIAAIDLSNIKTVLDVGSSTKEFRTRTQPYIDENVFKPLREKGKSIYYLDQKTGEGIDLVYDIENVSAKEIGEKFDMVICSNLMEHVHSPERLASLLFNLTDNDGFLLVTVPQTYRYHEDPIDTMFRPSMDKLASLFAGLHIINKATIRVRDKEKYVGLLQFLRYLIPPLSWKVNCLFMRKMSKA